MFARRADDALMEHSRLMVLDFDKLDDVQTIKYELAQDRYIFAIWISPSGNGLKALVHLKFPDQHRAQFNALEEYFLKHYGLQMDGSGRNESRALFRITRSRP